MLCLDEGTPVIMALCLLGAVLFIVGGSFWGNGDYTNDRQKTVAGISLFAISLVLLGLAGLGCYCNRFFCTPDRKSRIALRLYGSRRPLPPADGAPEDGTSADGSELADPATSELQAGRSKDPDWEEYAGGASSYRSFRSGRNSTRGRSKRASFRRDKVVPSDAEIRPEANNRTDVSRQQPQPSWQPPASASQAHIPAAKNRHGIVPVEFGDAQTAVELKHRIARDPDQMEPFRPHGTSTTQHQQQPGGNPALPQQQQWRQQQQQHQYQTRHSAPLQSQQPPQYRHEPMTVTPHMSLQPNGAYPVREHANPRRNGDAAHGHAGFRASAPDQPNESALVSEPVNV